MGKQINFYLLPSDLDALESKLKDACLLIILHSKSSSSSPRELSNLNLTENNHRWLFYYFVHPDDIDSLVINFVPKQNHWVIDVLRSPIIEVTSCFYDGKILRRGRVYYTDKFYGKNDEVVEKTENFKKWAQQIFLVTKKNLLKLNKDYIGEETKQWLEQSGNKIH
ncbi:hypothetical protein [Methylovulum psychrotolerans]|uniref:Uncharacterized protein n=1 Tax=Methylovulum psychrotolerans TaxID=1704499 RepID=A0A1Z4BVM0_9GAMM|nr:hypothetical protein [Methylovulum psychrotolerans]ASF45336.1 hypothetical protein CEK71_04230 [Methylovulum psychrotolerans]